MRKNKLTGLSDKASDVILLVMCTVIMLIVAYPLYYVLIASFSDPYDVYAGKTFLLPSQFTLKGYTSVFADSKIFSGYINSIKYTVIGTLFSVVMVYITAYPLSRRNLPGRKWISIFFIITMYFGGGLVPSYLNVRDLGLFDTRWAMVIPSLIGTTNLIILKSGFESVPESLIESAKLDGASYFKILLQVVLPLAKASLAVIALYYGVSYWNAWFNASIYIQDVDKYPLQLVMRNIINYTTGSFEDAAANDMANIAELMKYAMIVVGTVPILAIYPFVQKYFVKGTMIGAVKG